jgi:NADPH:quinone reductase-like Zn-dependent oxidoreductase
MKAVLLTGFGGPEKLDYREDVPVPEPQAGEVLVEVAAAGINNTDIWTREGAYGQEDDAGAVGGWRREPFVFPRIQGGDIAGRIVVVGQAVPASRIGERVLVDPVLYTDTGDGLVDASLIGSERDGGFAEYVAVPAANARTIHTTLSGSELATFPIAYITAERMLNRARVAAEETVFITGASGGVGSALLQLARARGARTVALVGPGKEEQAHSIGAEAVIIRGSGELAGAVGSALGGRAIDVVADLVGGSMFSELLSLLRSEGRYVSAGAIAGPIVELDLRTLYLKHLELIGSTMGTRKEFTDLVGHIESGRIKPLLAATYTLKDIARAQQDFKKKAFFGKLVLLPR